MATDSKTVLIRLTILLMKQQPGFISTQLHRGIAESCTFINYVVWESTSQFKQALSNPQFQTKCLATLLV